MSSDTSYDNPVEEGGDITFTVTRSATGSSSTVYLSTTQGGANSDDYNAIDKLPVVFAAQQTSKTVTVSTISDTDTKVLNILFLIYIKPLMTQMQVWASWGTGYIKIKLVQQLQIILCNETSHNSGIL